MQFLGFFDMLLINPVLGLNLILGGQFLVIVDLDDSLGDVRNFEELFIGGMKLCLLYTSPSPRDRTRSRMPSSA